jgi:uncharacterized RDD family membrane protein YckC
MTDTNTGGVTYGGFWIRVVAYIIDIIVLIVPLGAVYFLLPAPMENGIPIGMNPMGAVANTLIVAAYVTLLDSSAKQGTLGKMVLGLKVTTLAGERLNFVQALYRAWPYYIGAAGSAIGAFIGMGPILSGVAGLVALAACISVAFTARKQGIHDMMAGTVIVKK